MNYREITEDKNPVLLKNLIPFFSDFMLNEKVFKYLLSFAIIVVIVTCVYMFFEDKKTPNKILLARESMLNAQLVKQENLNDFLEAEILLLNDEAKSLSIEKDKKKLQKISKFLTDTELKGKGVEITLSDSKNLYTPLSEETAIIHNTDLLKIVNFLWSTEAEAISINDERLVLDSSITCIGPTILLNKKRINSPFVIRAINKKINDETVKNSTIMLSLKLRGIEFKVKNVDEILIPAGKYTNIQVN